MLKPIPEFPDYLASDDGEIWSMKIWGSHSPRAKKPTEPRKIKAKINTRGRRVVCLRRNGKPVHTPIAPLILSAFVGSRPPRMFACHGPNGLSDDSLLNLYWATQSQNVMDKYRDGTMICGERHRCAKLNPLKVRIIRKSYAPHGQFGLSSRELAEIFGVTFHAIDMVLKRKTWITVP